MKRILRVVFFVVSLSSAVIFFSCSDSIDEEKVVNTELENSSECIGDDFARYCYGGSYGFTGNGNTGSGSGLGGR